jgi:hypothetical protein
MKNSLLLPVLVGAAVAGAMAYFLLSDDMAELREELTGKLPNWDDVKEKAKERVAASLKSADEAAHA